MQQKSLLEARGGGSSEYHHVIKFADCGYFNEIINRNIQEIFNNLKKTALINRCYRRYGRPKIMFILQKTMGFL